MATLQFDQLAKRVQALGHVLVQRPPINPETDEHTDPGLYVVDPASGTFALTPTTHGRNDDLREVDNWCTDRETDAADAKLFSDAGVPKGFEHVARWLAELEACSQRTDLGAIIDHLRRGQYDVLQRVDAGDGEDDYQIAHGWTEHGVRHAWAELQLIGALRGYTDVVRPDTKAKKSGAA